MRLKEVWKNIKDFYRYPEGFLITSMVVLGTYITAELINLGVNIGKAKSYVKKVNEGITETLIDHNGTDIKNFELEKIDVNKNGDNSFIKFKGKTEFYSVDDYKFTALTYAVDEKMIDEMYSELDHSGRMILLQPIMQYLQNFINVIENDTPLDISTTDFGVSENSEKALRQTYGNETTATEFSDNQVYLSQEENVYHGNKKLKNQLHFLSKPIINSEQNTISFEAEVLVKAYSEREVNYGESTSTETYVSFQAIKKQVYSLPLTNELINNPNGVYNEVLLAISNKSSNLKTDVFLKENRNLTLSHVYLDDTNSAPEKITELAITPDDNKTETLPASYEKVDDAELTFGM